MKHPGCATEQNNLNSGFCIIYANNCDVISAVIPHVFMVYVSQTIHAFVMWDGKESTVPLTVAVMDIVHVI